MEQRLSMITLGVADLQESKQFYEQVVGWNSAHGPEGIAFFDLGGMVLSLYPHYLGMYPQDAAYHQIRLNKDRTLVTADLDRALNTSIVVEAQPTESASGVERDTG